MGLPQSVRCHRGPLEVGFGSNPCKDHLERDSAQLTALNVVTEMQISAAWLNSARQQVTMEKPHKSYTPVL